MLDDHNASPVPTLLFETSVSDAWEVLAPVGELDCASAPQLRDALAEHVRSSRLILDLSEVTFLDSTGLGVLIAFRSSMADPTALLRLVVTTPQIRRVFEITGLSSVFDIYDARATAAG